MYACIMVSSYRSVSRAGLNRGPRAGEASGRPEWVPEESELTMGVSCATGVKCNRERSVSLRGRRDGRADWCLPDAAVYRTGHGAAVVGSRMHVRRLPLDPAAWRRPQ